MQVRNSHVDKAVAKVALIRYVDTALFYIYLEFLNGISIRICIMKRSRLRDLKGKEATILDVSATLTSLTLP